MADSRQDENTEHNLPKPDSSEDDRTSTSTDPLSENDIFDSDREFFAALDASALKAAGKSHGHIHQDSDRKTGSRLRRIELILITGIVSIAAALVYRFYNSRPGAQHQNPAPNLMQYQTAKDPTSASANASQQQPDKTEDESVENQQPLSLKLANDLFMQNDYFGAFRAYERLDQTLLQNSQQQSMHSFLKARMAVCLTQLKHIDQAEKLLRIASAGDSCAITAIAEYQRALIEFERNQYFEARTHAYRAMALCEAVTADVDWALTLKKDCHFLIALALTRRIESLSDLDGDIPAKLWRTNPQADFGCDMTESQLETFLKSGNTKLTRALMEPKVKKLTTDNELEHFEVTSNVAPAEELFARFAANVNTRLLWNLSKQSYELRRRSVTLFLPDVTGEEFFTVAAGCVGLQVNTDSTAKRPTLIFSNPTDYTELSSHISSIAVEALERWQEFIIKYHEDKRIPNAHFACGIIYQVQGQTIESITQFKLVANRYGNSSLAPYALLHSSKIKADMHDYTGAKQDLKQLVEQYHQTAIAQTACLHLADAAFKAELYNEAANTYSKVYSLDDSLESRSAAAFGAAKAIVALGDYALAETWLTRYLNLTTQQELPEIHKAYLLLGKTQLVQGKRLQAFNAFKLALHEELTFKDRTEIIAALLECDLDSLDPIQALDILDTLQSQGLSPDESTEALLMKCRILRRMHLAEKALATMNDRIDYIIQPKLRARAYFEIGQCYIETGQIQNAYNCFARLMAITEPGSLTDRATVILAELSLKLDKNDKAIKLCSQILDRQVPDDLQQTAVSIMVQAYKKQNNYEKAITILLEYAQDSKDEPGKKTADGSDQIQPSAEETMQQGS